MAKSVKSAFHFGDGMPSIHPGTSTPERLTWDVHQAIIDSSQKEWSVKMSKH